MYPLETKTHNNFAEESRKRAGDFYGRRVRVLNLRDKISVDGTVIGRGLNGDFMVMLDETFTANSGAFFHTAFIAPDKLLKGVEVFDFEIWLD